MPIPLFSIPSHISDSIIQKLNLSDFVRFHQCSQKSFNTSMQVKTRFRIQNPIHHTFPFILELAYWNQTIMMKYRKSNGSYPSYSDKPFLHDLCYIPVRFDNCEVTVNSEFTDDYCISLVNFIQNTNSSFNIICLSEIYCSPYALQQLVEIQNVKEVWFKNPLSLEHMQISAIKKKSYFKLKFMEEAEILLFEAMNYKIGSSNLTSLGINRILQALVNESREIFHIEIGTKEELDESVIFEDIPTSMTFCGTTRIGKNGSYLVSIKNNYIDICRM